MKYFIIKFLSLSLSLFIIIQIRKSKITNKCYHIYKQQAIQNLNIILSQIKQIQKYRNIHNFAQTSPKLNSFKFKNLNIPNNNNNNDISERRKFHKNDMKISSNSRDTLLHIGQYLSDFPIYKRVVANNFRRRWLIMTCTYKRHDEYRFPIPALASSSRKCASLANFRSESRDFRAARYISLRMERN